MSAPLKPLPTEEGLLYGVLHVLPIAEDGPGDLRDPLLRQDHELLECGRVSGLRRADGEVERVIGAGAFIDHYGFGSHAFVAVSLPTTRGVRKAFIRT
jgi:hypothetical protein